jgi:hypothetical protein
LGIVFQLFLTFTIEAELYQIVLDAALSDPNTPHGREGYYFGASDEYRLYDLAKAYSQALYDLGKGKSPEPTPFTEEEAQKYFGVSMLSSSKELMTDVAMRDLGSLARP